MAIPASFDAAGLPLDESSTFRADTYSNWDWYYIFFRAIQERMPIFCDRYFPPTTNRWQEGIIATLTNTELTDAAMIPTVGPPVVLGWGTDAAGAEAGYDYTTSPTDCGGGHHQRWNGWCVCDPDGINPCWAAVPRKYEVIIGGDCETEPWRCIKRGISSNGFFTLRFGDLGLTSDELDGLVGKRYYIIREEGLAWHERIPYGNPRTLTHNRSGSGSALVGTDFTITGITRIGTVATAVCPSHGYENGDTITITGATQTGYNLTSATISNVTDSTFDYTVSGSTVTPATTSSSFHAHRTNAGYRFVDAANGGSWFKDHFIGKTIAFDSSVLGGYTRFGTIVGNSRRSITFTAPAPFVPTGGRYAVMSDPSSIHYSFDLEETDILNWQRQLGTTYFSRKTNGEAAGNGTTIPKAYIAIAAGDCMSTVDVPLFDIDMHTDLDNICIELSDVPANKRDNFVSPHFYKSWRGLQAFVEAWCGNWCNPGIEDVTDAILQQTPATMFYHAGINATLEAVTLDETGHPDQFGLGTITTGCHEGVPYYYTIVWRDQQLATGVAFAYDGQPLWIEWLGANHDDCGTPRYETAKVYGSLGWTRPGVQRQFLRMNDVTYMEPDFGDSVDGAPPLPETPSAAFPGTWTIHDKSTCYAVSNSTYLPDGSTISPVVGRTVDSTEAFVTGEIARYVGDNWGGTSTDLGDTTTPQYAEYVVKGDCEAACPDHLNGGYFGRATGGSTTKLIDTKQHWCLWGEWSGSGGTATGGGTDNIICTTMNPVYGPPDPDTGETPLVSGDLRWDSLTGRWVDFVVEPTNGPLIGQKAVITGYDQASQTISFSSSDLAYFNWQHKKNTITVANVGVGDIFTVTLDGTAYAYTALTTSSAEVLAGLFGLIKAANVSGVLVTNDGSLVIQYATTMGYSISVSATDGDTHNTQTITNVDTTEEVTFRIHEPKFQANRFKGRTIKVIKYSDGSVFTGTITHTADDTLWVTGLGTTVEVNDAYEIIEARPGTVWQWNGSNWVMPSSCNTVDDQLRERPTVKTKYGRAYKGDYWTATHVNEMYRVTKNFTDTTGDYGWTAKGELNTHGTPEDGTDTTYTSDPVGDTIGYLTLDYADPDFGSSHDAAPYMTTAIGAEGGTGFPTVVTGLANGRWAYAQINPTCCALAVTIDFYIFASYYLNYSPAYSLLTWDTSNPNIATHSNGYCDDGENSVNTSFTNSITITVPGNPILGSPGSFPHDGGTIDELYTYDKSGDSVLEMTTTNALSGNTSYSRQELKYVDGIGSSYNKWSRLGTYSGYGDDTAIFSGKMGPTSLPPVASPPLGGGDQWSSSIQQGFYVAKQIAILRWSDGLNYK